MNRLLLTVVGSIFVLGGAVLHSEAREPSLLICEQEPTGEFAESVPEKPDSSSAASRALSDSPGRAPLTEMARFEWDTSEVDTGETIVLTPPSSSPTSPRPDKIKKESRTDLPRGGPNSGGSSFSPGWKIDRRIFSTDGPPDRSPVRPREGFDKPKSGIRGMFIRPINGGYKSQGIHDRNAVDLARECGNPVVAAATGTVRAVYPRGSNGGYGRYVIMEHERGIVTLYAHLSQVLVMVGQFVEQGFPIGLVGTTGNSTGCHLHFEVRGARNPF